MRARKPSCESQVHITAFLLQDTKMTTLQKLSSLVEEWYYIEFARAVRYGEVETAKWLAKEIKKLQDEKHAK